MGGSHLLIVEDNVDLNEMVCELFEREGYVVMPAFTGTEALEITRSKRVDLALLDVRLPDIDGFAVFRHLRENPETRRIPVILLTERRERSNRLHGLELGVVDYITKPFDSYELKLRVRNALSRSQMRKSSNPVTEFPLAPETDRKLAQLFAYASEWTAFQLSLVDIDRFKNEYGFIAGADLLRAVALTLRSVLRDLDQESAYVGHVTTDDIVFLVPPNVADKVVESLKSRLADVFPRFLPPKARQEGARPVDIRLARVNHDNPSAKSVDALRTTLKSSLSSIVY
ncbi:MAG: response regulator [Chloroflexi bacterium]|nr:response regulator [Chloroflexota bacterium]